MAYLLKNVDGVEIYRAQNNSAAGHPRVIVHFTDFLRPSETCADLGGILAAYEKTKKRARVAGFRPYTAREFGGGFILATYENPETIAARVIESRKTNI